MAFCSLLTAAPASHYPAPLAVQTGRKEDHRSQKVWSSCSEDWSPGVLINMSWAAQRGADGWCAPVWRIRVTGIFKHINREKDLETQSC